MKRLQPSAATQISSRMPSSSWLPFSTQSPRSSATSKIRKWAKTCETTRADNRHVAGKEDGEGAPAPTRAIHGSLIAISEEDRRRLPSPLEFPCLSAPNLQSLIQVVSQAARLALGEGCSVPASRRSTRRNCVGQSKEKRCISPGTETSSSLKSSSKPHPN